MADGPKAVVERFLRESRDPATGEWRPDVISACFDVDRYFSHTWGAGLVETGRRMGRFFAAFSAGTSSFRRRSSPTMISWCTGRVGASHIGAVIGIAATGRVVEMNDVEMWRVEGGKIVEHWGGIGEAQHLYEQIAAER